MTLRVTNLSSNTLVAIGLTLSFTGLACKGEGNTDDEVGETGESGTATDGETGTSNGDTTTADTESTTADTETTTADTETTADTDSTDSTGDGDGDVPPCPYTAVDGDPGVTLEVVGEGLRAPTFVIGHPKQPDRLFVTLKSGDIVIIEPGSTQANPTPFLSLEVNDFSEMGVLAMDFHPDFPADPRVYVHYSPLGDLRSRVSEFTLDANDPDVADPASERILYDKPQSQANHNGGQVAFGPDGYLYFSIGDGGEQGDPTNDAQNLGTHYGKIMRIDIAPSGNEEYTIPADNPFIDDPEALPEIWAYGFRNPWRFSFDSATDWMYVGDVGQNAWEEIDIVNGGGNYGWRPMEGTHCFNPMNGCDTNAGPNEENSQGYIMPIHDYGGQFRSVTGGYVYHSCQVPAWDGHYFFADYVIGSLWSLTWDGTTMDFLGEAASVSEVGSLGSNAWGDVYVAETILSNQSPFPAVSNIYRVAPQ
ncbi:PQQ-dependent sugar dehydrogenase [Nannocystaceae bacterium ST9]